MPRVSVIIIPDMESKRIYERLVEALPLGLVVIDADGRISDLNPAACEVTGLSAEDAVGRDHREVIHGPEGACPLAGDGAKPEGGPVETEARVRTLRGEVRVLKVTSVPLTGPSGEAGGGIEVFEDVTERRRGERERENFAAMFVHDMKNPLKTSEGFLDRLLDGKYGPVEEGQRERLELVRGEVEKLFSMVEDFLEYSRFDSEALAPEPEGLDMGGVIKKVVEAARLEAEEKDVRIEYDPPPDGAAAEADPVMADRLVTNLMENAVKYTSAGKRVTVRCEPRGRVVEVEVRNPGAGVSDDEAHRLFDAFRRGREEGPGSGLGLAIARQIVRAHGGRIWARVTEDDEMVITFTLPAAEDKGR